MIEITNQDAIFAQLDEWELEIRALTEEVARGIAIKAFETLLRNSAQYTGDFAANWTVSVNYQNAVGFTPFNSTPRNRSKANGLDGAFIMGDSPAMREAWSRQSGMLNNFRLGDEITISNASEHTEPYAQLIEDGSIKFRAGNYGRPVAITYAIISTQYKELTLQDIRELKGLRL